MWNRNSHRSYFWQDFLARVDEILERQLHRTVTAEFKVKGEHVAKFKPHLWSLGEYLRTHLESGGAIPDELLPKLPGAKRAKEGMVHFNTPPGATWSDLRIRFRDGHTVSVELSGQRGVFNYTQMGMASRKNGSPTVQWKLLEDFAEEHGTLDWSSPKADRKLQKRRELLARDLKAFFRIEGNPFSLTDDGKGWRARFVVALNE